MLIRNITNKSTPKVVGVGHMWLQPGEEKYVPDDGLYVDEVDQYGKLTGKKVIINALKNQVRLNMLEIVEDKQEDKEESVEKSEKENPVEDQVVEETPKKTRATRTTKKKTT